VRYTRRAARFWIWAAVIIALAASQVKAFDAQVSWSPVPSVAGYRVYVRQDGQPYAGGTDVGPLQADIGGVVRYISRGLSSGVVNYAAVTAYDGFNQESGFSNELSVSVTAPPAATATRSASATATRTGPAATPTRTAILTAPPTATSTAPATATPQPSNTRTATPVPTATTAPASASPTMTPAVAATRTMTRTVPPTSALTATPSPTSTPIPLTAVLTIWPPGSVPAYPSVADAAAVELGVKFTSDVNGVIRGIRFYKGAANTGKHTGSLWASSGRRLTTAMFKRETASGWQQVYFASPVAISAGVVYVASYNTKVGRYAADENYFAAAGVDRGPLHAPRDGANGGNGVYAYGRRAFPANSYRATNYWVDVIFSPTQ
jgi:Domain of unknown function (DUF4082)